MPILLHLLLIMIKIFVEIDLLINDLAAIIGCDGVFRAYKPRARGLSPQPPEVLFQVSGPRVLLGREQTLALKA